MNLGISHRLYCRYMYVYVAEGKVDNDHHTRTPPPNAFRTSHSGGGYLDMLHRHIIRARNFMRAPPPAGVGALSGEQMYTEGRDWTGQRGFKVKRRG